MAELANGAFDYYRRRLRELEEENRKLREALERIANAEPGDIPASSPDMTSEDCYACEELIDIAREALAALGGVEKGAKENG